MGLIKDMYIDLINSNDESDFDELLNVTPTDERVKVICGLIEEAFMHTNSLVIAQQLDKNGFTTPYHSFVDSIAELDEKQFQSLQNDLHDLIPDVDNLI